MLTFIPSVFLKRALVADGLHRAGLRRCAPAAAGLAAPGMAGSGCRS
jgi:hypothetical protein